MEKLSHLFTKTKRDAPQGEVAVNAILLERAGFIAKQMAGVYTLLPFGLRVVNKINTIIRGELNAIGAQEILMPALQPKEIWEKTGRWNTANDVMYQFKDNSGKDVGLGWTHEEVITQIATSYIHSYKDLPKAVYQIQTKFRDEPRAKSGILRGREFVMKDLYSFHTDQKDRDDYYDKVKGTYHTIFKRIGLNALETAASGGAFSKLSHEFQVIAKSGEDTVFICETCSQGINKEIMQDAQMKCEHCGSTRVEKTSIEVGNIFKLGTRFSEALDLKYTDEEGKQNPVEMCSYGIGPTRVMGTIVEVSHDEKGIIWGESVAPYDCHIIEILNSKFETLNKSKNQNYKSETMEIINQLEKAGLEVLFDDRDDVSVGEKLADADLIGIPWRIVVSDRSIAAGGVEVKRRSEEESQIVPVDKLLDIIKPVP